MVATLFGRRRKPKVMVIGLDCAEPSLVFDRLWADLPNLRQLVGSGRHGDLESTVPAITVPAWACMFSGRDPGELGFYGFRNRADYSYERMVTATSASVKAPRVWDLAGDAGKQVIVVGVPQTYPPRAVNGLLVGDWLAPGTHVTYTWPADLGDEIRSVVGDYVLDVRNFRTTDKANLLQQIYDMTERRFTLVKHLMRNHPWDLFMFVEIGVDRIHHGMWKYTDPRHPKYEPGNPYEHSIRDYYVYLDERIGELLQLLPDDATVLVLSDHGARPMMGGFCLNDWLIREGLLVLEKRPEGIADLHDCTVDWSRTRAWGAGGYYARVTLNVQGREPQGTVPASEYRAFRDALAARLEALPQHDGQPMGTRAFRPEDVYAEVTNIPPDLIVYLGDLAWRSIGSVGHQDLYCFENDTGPDDANHAQQGLYIVADGRHRRGEAARPADWRSVAPTILEHLSIKPPKWMDDRPRL